LVVSRTEKRTSAGSLPKFSFVRSPLKDITSRFLTADGALAFVEIYFAEGNPSFAVFASRHVLNATNALPRLVVPLRLPPGIHP
jgi:hypothetical protein